MIDLHGRDGSQNPYHEGVCKACRVTSSWDKINIDLSGLAQGRRRPALAFFLPSDSNLDSTSGSCTAPPQPISHLSWSTPLYILHLLLARSLIVLSLKSMAKILLIPGEQDKAIDVPCYSLVSMPFLMLPHMFGKSFLIPCIKQPHSLPAIQIPPQNPPLSIRFPALISSPTLFPHIVLLLVIYKKGTKEMYA